MTYCRVGFVVGLLAMPGLLFSDSGRAGIALTMVPQEEGAPVFISKAKSTPEYIFEYVTVKNRSDRSIKSIKFGVAFQIRDANGLRHPAHFWAGPAVPVNLKPGEQQIVHALTMSHNDVKSHIANSPAQARAAQLGVLEVVYADGQKWRFEASKDSGFNGMGLSQLLDSGRIPCKPGRTLAIAQIASLKPSFVTIPAGYFTCVTNTDCIYCTNNVSSCTVSVCSTNPSGCASCPHEACSYVP